MEPEPVDLFVYDLSSGLAALLSPALLDGADEPLVVAKEADDPLGRCVDGVWHTAVVVYGREFFYGAGGVTSCTPGGTALGAPLRVERLGATHVPYAVFLDYLEGLAVSAYTGAAYRLLEHNCNHFSDEVAAFLCGARVPKHIVQQGERALPPPLRQAAHALLGALVPDASRAGGAEGVRRVRHQSPDYDRLNTSIEEARAAGAVLEARRGLLAEKAARRLRRAERRKRRSKKDADAEGEVERELSCSEEDMAEAVAQAQAPAVELAGAVGGVGGSEAAGGEVDELDKRTQAELRRRELDPPILFTDIDAAHEFEQLCAALGEECQLTAEEQQSLEELRQYLVAGEGSWVLGDDFLALVGRVLQDEALAPARAPLLRSLAAAALRDDVALLLHQDRKHHALLNFAHSIDRLPPHEQLAVALFMCNLFANISSSEWLLYISEWEHNGQQLSNIRATTKVCVHAVLAECDKQRDAGTALLYNLAAREVKTVVFDEVCAELALAALQLAGTRLAGGGSGSGPEGEQQLWRCMAALARLAAHSADVPQLVALVGPDPDMFRGVSPRVDEQIDLIKKRVK